MEKEEVGVGVKREEKKKVEDTASFGGYSCSHSLWALDTWALESGTIVGSGDTLLLLGLTRLMRSVVFVKGRRTMPTDGISFPTRRLAVLHIVLVSLTHPIDRSSAPQFWQDFPMLVRDLFAHLLGGLRGGGGGGSGGGRGGYEAIDG